MTAILAPTARKNPFILTSTHERILRAVYQFLFMTALDVAHLLFSPKSLTHVREILTALAGSADYQTNRYLYRFSLPNAQGNSTRIYTLGGRGRNVLAREFGLPVDESYFRPYKYKFLSHAHVLHDLILTRFLISASVWARRQPDFTLSQIRTCYELARAPTSVSVTAHGKTKTLPVVPDAWLLFETKSGKKYPILLEIDRGMEYQQKLKQHVRSRIEFIRSGEYNRVFATPAVIIAYVTTGQTPAYRETRRNTMARWTMEVLQCAFTGWTAERMLVSQGEESMQGEPRC